MTNEKFIDDLTGLYNMKYFKIKYDAFNKENKNSKLIAIDFVKLKYINDNFGHSGGDSCLSSFGKLLKSSFNNDLCFRRSGDEFLVLTSRSNEEIESNLKKIIQKAEEFCTLGLVPVAFSFNCGIIETEHSISSSLDKADATMYNAKEKGILFEYFSKEVYEKSKESKNFIDTISNEVIQNEITFSYSNVYDFNKEKTNLLDIYSRDHDSKSIFEGDKLDLLKTSYVLKKLDYSNLREIIMFYNKSDKENKLIINIHSQTLLSRDIDFNKYITALCNVTENNTSEFVICINVDSLLEDWNQVIPKLALLKNLGFQIILGSYDLSINNPLLNIWKDTDVDYVKISKKSWQNSIKNDKEQDLLKNTLNLFNQYGTTPIFMKVETEGELNYLKSLNSKSLYVGNVNGQEQKLIYKSIKK